jgi:hypothetical protein
MFELITIEPRHLLLLPAELAAARKPLNVARAQCAASQDIQ